MLEELDRKIQQSRPIQEDLRAINTEEIAQIINDRTKLETDRMMLTYNIEEIIEIEPK